MKKVCPANRYGLYFKRLIAYGENRLNQLEHILDIYAQGIHRHSALQASILDPAKDITAQRQRGFPCLQQVAFQVVPGAGLVVTGFYAIQHFFQRAYGNYVGLCRLGKFMAQAMDMDLVRMNCVASVAQLGAIGKGDLSQLSAQLSTLVERGTE